MELTNEITRAQTHTEQGQAASRLHVSSCKVCVCVFQMVSWTVSTQTVVVSRCVWVPRCAKARLIHVTSFSRATPFSRHALHVSSSTVWDFSLDGTAHTYCQETCHLTAGDKHTLANINTNTLSHHTRTHNLITRKTQFDCDLSQIIKGLLARYFTCRFSYFPIHCCAIPLRFWVKEKAGCATSTVIFCKSAIDILAQTLVTTDSTDWPFKAPARIRSDILILMRNWSETAQTHACPCVLMLVMFWLEKWEKRQGQIVWSHLGERVHGLVILQSNFGSMIIT